MSHTAGCYSAKKAGQHHLQAALGNSRKHAVYIASGSSGSAYSRCRSIEACCPHSPSHCLPCHLVSTAEASLCIY